MPGPQQEEMDDEGWITVYASGNGLACWELSIACQRAELEAGRKLTPEEMIAAVDTKVAADD